VRRLLAVAVVLAVAVGAAVGLALARRHDDGNPTVAQVGGDRITRHQLDLMVEHFHEEADREGRPFPDSGTGAFRRVEQQSLAFLVDRARLEVAAARAGIHVDNAEVRRRLGASAGGEEDSGAAVRAEGEAAFARGTARAQLLTEKVFARLTAHVTVAPAAVRAYYLGHRAQYGRTPFRSLAPAIRRQLLSARKNALLAAWLRRARAIPAEIRDKSLKG